MGLIDVAFQFTDPYDRPARLYPALLVLTPLAVLLVCLYGTANLLASTILSILGVCGVGYTLGRVARNAGKRIEASLFTKWGGAPTTQVLRYSHPRYDSHTKERYHAVLSNGVGKSLPSRADESTDPTAADELYRASTAWLIERTRDAKAFPLVFKENVAFGFHRNALGMRPFGVALAIVCIFWALLSAKVILFSRPYVDVARLGALPPAVIVTLAVSIALLVLWFMAFGEQSLKQTGFAYAERLVESCDRLKATAAREPREGVTSKSK